MFIHISCPDPKSDQCKKEVKSKKTNKLNMMPYHHIIKCIILLKETDITFPSKESIKIMVAKQSMKNYINYLNSNLIF